jgi:hypothetical protein
MFSCISLALFLKYREQVTIIRIFSAISKLHNFSDELRSGKRFKIKIHRMCVEQRTYTGRPFIIERKRIQFQTQRALIISINVVILESVIMV